MAEQSIKEEVKGETNLRNMYDSLSRPQPTLNEALGDDYSKRVTGTDDPRKKIVIRYNGDLSPEEVFLDGKDRYIRITSKELEQTFIYDEDGYLTKASLTKGNGQGLDRSFTYRPGKNGLKELVRLEVTPYGAVGFGHSKMQRGEQNGEIQVVNFDMTGKPDGPSPFSGIFSSLYSFQNSEWF